MSPTNGNLNPSAPRWTKSGWGFKVTTQDQLMRAVSRIGTLSTGRRFVWRGVENAQWPVQSSLVRWLRDRSETAVTEDDVRHAERGILETAREWGVGGDLAGQATDLHLLAYLQHHRLPTRLLDVTSNPMTALYFACRAEPGTPKSPGALFAFDVTAIPEVATTASLVQVTYEGLADPLGWGLSVALRESAEQTRPFLVRPSMPDRRMVAQEGLFISGAALQGQSPPGVDGFPFPVGQAPGQEKLETLFAPEERKRGRPKSLPFCALVIPSKVKEQMLRHLAGTFNRTERTMFPDVDGFAHAFRTGMVTVSTPSDATEGGVQP